jgi:hypothetical protein
MNDHERRLRHQDPEQRRPVSIRQRVLKALEKWHPGYLDWWNDMGPDGFQESLVYLRTASASIPRAGPSSTT